MLGGLSDEGVPFVMGAVAEIGREGGALPGRSHPPFSLDPEAGSLDSGAGPSTGPASGLEQDLISGPPQDLRREGGALPGRSHLRIPPRTLHLPPFTPHPALYRPHPTSYTLHPTPCTLHPAPYTIHPAPYTLHPTPYTLHPTPPTLHPPPSTQSQGGACGVVRIGGPVRL